MHMASSSLPDSVARKVKVVPGVNSVTPIHYLANNIVQVMNGTLPMLSRRREYGMLKALGARNTHFYLTVLAQALLSVTLGFLFYSR